MIEKPKEKVLKPLICDLPYPSTDTLTKDVRSGQIISFAYATLHGELTATLQYVYHHFYFGEMDENDAEILMAIAKAEMMHIDILGKAMLKLGVSPKYVQMPNTSNFYNTCSVSQSTTPQKMLMDDIQGELNAIADYQKMLFILKNELVEAIIQRIILDEQLHLEKLKEMLKKYAK
ncbi:MAG: hypothetical protein J1F66_01085 [Clostridiales bacterium]|nr:hypothetical protein [Clostridiales bacterium]